MSTTLPSLRRSLPGILFLSLLAAPAGAVQHQVRILMDQDDDPGTGCLVNTVDGPFDGVEQILITTVETSSPPEAGTVTDVATSDCVDDVADIFGAPASFDGGWPVGIGNGVGGRDVVETYLPLIASAVPDPAVIRLGVVVTDELGAEQALLTTNDAPDGPDIILDLRSVIEIPTLGEWGLILLALLLAAVSLALLGRRGTAALGLVVVVLATGTAWAAVSLDGLTDDWSAGDQLASNGIVLFGREEGGNVCFRVDVDLVFNSGPEAADDAFATDEDSPISPAAPGVLGNDSDPDSDPLTVSDHDPTSAQGAVVSVSADGSFSYEPTGAPALQALDDGESVDDTFGYTASDGSATDTATVTVTVDGVNDPPVAMDDGYETDEDTPLVIAAPGVLVNDDDVDVEAITAVLDTDVSDGTLALNPDGSFTYTPDPDFNGVDSFTYHASDGDADSAVVTATITVGPVNDGPNAVDDTFMAGEDAALVEPAPGVLTNDTDPEMDALTVTGSDSVSTEGAAVSVNADGSFSYDPTGAAALQALDDGEMVDDTFTYTVDDGSGTPDTATVTVTVTGANDPPVAADDGYTTDEDVGLNVPAPGVLGNDTDVDVETLTTVLVSGPSNAAAFVLNANGSFSYTPAANFNGSDSFTYRASDGTVTSNLATVTITVDPVNDPPVADDETVIVACNLEHVVENAPGETAAAAGSIFRTVADNVLVGDSDPVEMSAVAIVGASGLPGGTTDSTGPDFIITTDQGGSLTLHADGSFVYSPEGGDRNLMDSFTYTLQDAEGAQDTATVTLDVADVCVWFVDNSTGPDDTGTGSSSDPFTSLVDELGPDALADDAEDASQPGDVIYVFEGNSRTGDPYDGNFNAEANERILGQGVDLVVDLGGGPETLFTGNPANRPMIDGVSAGVGVSVIDVTGVEVAGVELIGGDHSVSASSIAAPFGLDLHDVVASGSSNEAFVIDQNGAFDSTATLTDNSVTSSGGNAIQVEVSAGTLELALDGNAGLTSSGSAIALDGGGGSLFITSFCGNSISGATSGTGIEMFDVIFDADPADPDFTGDEVSCGTGTTVGSLADPIDGFGIIFDGVRGDLDLGQLDVFAGVPGGGDETALEIFALNPFNVAGDGFQLTTSGGTVSSIDGPAIVIDPTDLEAMVLDSVVSQGSAGAGIHLNQVSGSFQVTGTTDIDGAAGAGIEILSSPVDALFAATDVDNTTGVGVRYMNGTTGTLSFSGPLTIDTTTGTGFVASLGGTVTVLDNTSTVATATGTGVSVTSSTIGAGGMSFASVSVSGAANGIVLANAGAGDFSAAGGSLQNVTSRGLDVEGGTGDVTYGGSISTTASGRSVEVTNHGGGSTVALSGAIDENGLGILLDNNDVAGGSTITFSGGLDIDTGASAAFTATNGGTVNVLSGAVSTTADTSTGTVVNIADTAIGGSGVFFDSVGSTGGLNGILLTNAGSGAFTVNGGVIANKAERGVDVAGGTGNVTVTASISTAASGRSVEVTGHTGGVVDFNGAIDDNGLGIHLDANPGAVLRFDGQLDLDTGTNTAFNATNGGTVVVTAFGNDVDTTTGIGVNIVDTTIGGADVEFQSVSVNGAPNGIVLDSTGTAGQFRVVGDGSSTGGVTDRDGSGGTLASTTSHAVLLDQATGVSLRQVDITGAGADGIHSTGGGNTFLEAVGITSPAGDGWEATNLTGVNRIFSDSLISGIDNAGTSGVIVSNTNVDLTSLTLDGSTFTSSTGGQGMVVIRGLGTSNMTLEISDGNTADPADSVFSNLNQSAVVISAGTDAGSTSTITTNISDTEFRDGPVGGFNNVEIQALENGTANFDISNNLFSNLDPPGANSGIVLLQATVNGTLGATSGANGTVSGNTFTGIDGRRGIHLTSNNNASNHNVIVSGNTFQDLEREALFVSARDSTAGFDLRVTGNSFGTSANPVGNTDREAVEITAENSAVLNAELRNNDLVNSSGSGFSQALRLASLDNAVLNVSIRRSNPADAATGNTFRTVGTNTAFSADTSLGGTSTMCLELTGNDALSSAGASGGGSYALTETTGTFNVVDRDNTNANNAGTVTFTPAIGSFGDVVSCPAPSL